MKYLDKHHLWLKQVLLKPFLLQKNVMLLCLFMLLCSINLNAQSPVGANGKLKVSGTRMVNEAGNVVQLRGFSTHGINWFTDCYNFNSMSSIAKDWGADIFRIAVYPTEKPDGTKGGYEGNPDFWKKYVDDLVDMSEKLGMYCLIDWHVLTPGNPNDATYLPMAKEFWAYMSKKHAGKKHVLYEICNEPNGVNWPTVKTYAETIIPIIRANDPSTIIIVGSPTWSSDVDVASNNPITGETNIMYSFHFYAATHTQNYRDKISTAISNGLAIFATEWGTTAASGGGGANYTESDIWMNFLNTNKISWCNWSYSDKDETSAALIKGSASQNLWNNPTTSGAYVKNKMNSPADTWAGSANIKPAANISAPLNNAYFLNNSAITINADATDINGTISSVKFYVDGTLVGTDTSSPYSYVWTPTASKDYVLKTVATDNSNATGTSLERTIHIVNTINQTAYPNGTPTVIAAGTVGTTTTINTINFDNGGESIAYHDLDGVHKGPAGSPRYAEGVDVESSNNIGYINNDEWLEYTINISTAGTYDFTLNCASQLFPTGKMHLELDGTSITDVKSIPPSGNWGSYQPNTITGVSLPSGIHVLRLYFDVGYFNTSTFSFKYTGGGVNVPVTGVTLSPASVSLALNETTTLIATITPSDASNKSVTWTSSNTAIATVSSTGVVTGKAAGSATITVKTADGNKTAASAITVTNVNIPVTGVELVPATLSIEQGKSKALTANVLPANANNKAVTYSSSKTSVATVNASGVVTAVSLGSANITITTADGNFTDVSVITVTAATGPPLNAYPYGILPSNGSVADAQSAYNTFMNLFFEDCNDGKGRIKWGLATNGWEQPGQTVSEGIGYGMLLAAYYNDKTRFDKLWKYYKAFPDANGLMHWKTQGCSSVVEQNAATDAEVDAAMALIVADKAFGSSGSVNYESDAKWLIGKIKQNEVESGSYVLKPGDVFGGSSLTNISYFAPGYFRAFGQYTNDAPFWNNVVDTCYQIINANLTANNAVGGLVSDWCNASGNQAQGKSLDYSYDACRTNWRIATDYVWYGDSRAKAYLDKSNSFTQDFVGGIQNIKDGYKQNGSLISGQRYHNTTFISTFACAGVALNNVSELNTYYTEIGTVAPFSYFDYSFDILGRTLLTGLFQNPLSPTAVVPVTGITVSPTTASIKKGETKALTASVLPSNATNKNVTWSSSNTAIATVSSTGTVTAVAVGNATITATSSISTIKASCAVTVTNTTTAQQAYPNGVPHAIPGTIQPINYDTGGEGIAYHDADSGNSGAGIRQNEGVDTDTKIPAGNIGWVSTGEWLEYTVNVSQTGPYNINVLVASTGNSGAYHIEFGGVDKTGVKTVASTGGWGAFVTKTISNVSLTSGVQVMRVYMDGPGFNLGTITFSSNNTCAASPITANVKINSGALIQSKTATAKVGDLVLLSPVAANGGSWSWTGPSFSATSREVSFSNIQTKNAVNFVVT